MSNPRYLYETIFSALTSSTDLVGAGKAIEPGEETDRIYPSLDPKEAPNGLTITYGVSNWSWDRTASRGETILTVRVEHPDNKIEAHNVLDIVRSIVMYEASISDDNKIIVSLIDELPNTDEQGESASGKHEVTADFFLRMVKP